MSICFKKPHCCIIYLQLFRSTNCKSYSHDWLYDDKSWTCSNTAWIWPNTASVTGEKVSLYIYIYTVELM